MTYIAKTAKTNKTNLFTSTQLPNANNTYDFGSSSAYWSNAYINSLDSNNGLVRSNLNVGVSGITAGSLGINGTAASSANLSIDGHLGGGGIIDVSGGAGTSALRLFGSGSSYLSFSTSGSTFSYIVATSPTADRTFTLPDANSNPIRPLGSATTHQWVQYVDSSGVQHLSQPSYSDISGTPPASSFTISSKTTSFTASDGAGYYYRMSTNDMTVTLPASPADGSVRKFKMLTAGKTATFALNGAETINHATGESDQSLTLTYDQGVLELIAVSGGWDET